MDDPQPPRPEPRPVPPSGGRVRARAWFTPAGQPPPEPDARHPDDRPTPADPTGA